MLAVLGEKFLPEALHSHDNDIRLADGSNGLRRFLHWHDMAADRLVAAVGKKAAILAVVTTEEGRNSPVIAGDVEIAVGKIVGKESGTEAVQVIFGGFLIVAV